MALADISVLSVELVVSAQTKSGTNTVHGSVFEFMRNDHLQARNPFTQSLPIFGTNGRTIPVTRHSWSNPANASTVPALPTGVAVSASPSAFMVHVSSALLPLLGC